MFRLLPLLALSLFLLLTSVTAHAAPLPPGAAAAVATSGADGDEASEAAPVPTEVIDRVAPLSDEQVRRLLIQELSRQIQTPDGAVAMGPSGLASLLDGLRRLTAQVSARFEALSVELANWPATWERLFDNLTDLEGWPAVGFGAFAFLIMIIGGGAAEVAFTRLTRPAQARLATDDMTRVGPKFAFLSLRLLFGLLGILVFFGVAFLLSFVFFDRFDPMRVAVSGYLVVVVVVRVFGQLSTALLAPNRPEARLLVIKDSLAQRIHRATLLIVAVGATGFFTCAILELLGAPDVLHRGFVGLVGLVLTLMVCLTLLGVRDDIRVEMAKREAAFSPLLQAVAQFWHVLAIFYLSVGWLIWAINILTGRDEQAESASLSLGIVLAVPLIDRILHRLLMGIAEARAAYLGHEELSEQDTRGPQAILNVLRIVLGIIAFVLLLEAWDLGILAALQGSDGTGFTDTAFDVLITIALAYIAWEAVRVYVDKHVGPEEPAMDPSSPDFDPEAGKAVKTRAETLLPLFKKTVQVVLSIMVVMIVLSSIGVDIGPLLAGAGVVGLAIGFGAQALVRDIVAGVFFLVDDAFRVGEYIEIGDIRGEVESISIRSMRLRHHKGPVHTVPYGELKHITNHNRDWVMYKFEIRMPYDTDLEKVRKIAKTVGKELMKHPEVGHNFIQQLKSQGVRRMEESAMMVGFKFMCKPREQFYIRRFAYQRLQEELTKAGIEFAHRNVKVTLDGADHMSPEEQEKLKRAAGAGGALDDAMPKAPLPDTP